MCIGDLRLTVWKHTLPYILDVVFSPQEDKYVATARVCFETPVEEFTWGTFVDRRGIADRLCTKTGSRPATAGGSDGTPGGVPATTGRRPGSTGDFPRPTGNRPDTKGGLPSTAGDRPLRSDNRPSPTGDFLRPTGNRPDTKGGLPSTKGNRPGWKGHRPGTTGKCPTVRRDRPCVCANQSTIGRRCSLRTAGRPACYVIHRTRFLLPRQETRLQCLLR